MQNAKKNITNAREINKTRCIAGLAICAVVIILTLVFLVLNIIDFFNEGTVDSGINTLKMFTTISNIVALVASFACLPYQIDGLRKDKYKLPNWIVVLMYVGATGVFFTFTLAISVLSVFQGFVQIMFNNSNLLMHTLNPIAIVFLFTFIISDYRVKFYQSFIALAPITFYSIMYLVMVFATGKWHDIYHIEDYVPWPIALLAFIASTFVLSQVLRLLHNLNNKRVVKSIATYYKQSPDYDFPRVSDAVAHLAEIESKYYYEGEDIYIPVDIIQLLSERYSASKVPVDILYDIYLESYLRSINLKSE